MKEQSRSTPHPIQLHSTVFTRSSVVAIIGHDPEQAAEECTPLNKINIRSIEDEPGFYVGTMRTVVNEQGSDRYPYKIDVECHARLSADDTLSEEEAKRGIAITAHSVLYGAIREQVAWLTSRQPFGPLSLGLSILTPGPAPKRED